MKLMAEVVFSKVSGTHTIEMCRDGRVMLRVEALEKERRTGSSHDIKDDVARWTAYLNYLNTFYLLLDSSTIELSKIAFFNLHEITNRDAFRISFKDGKPSGESISAESLASVYQMERYISNPMPGVPLGFDARFRDRRFVVPVDVIEHASKSFDFVITQPGLEKVLASFAKSLSEFKVGNYETAIVLAWFISESVISHLWESHLQSLNSIDPTGKKRIDRERMDLLTGRDYTISSVSNLLELAGVLSMSLFQDIDAVRKHRNAIVHSLKFVPTAEKASLALKTAQELIRKRWGLNFSPSLGYSVIML